MHSLIAFVEAHQVLCSIAGYYVFSSIVGGMPSPDDKSSHGYVWAFNSLHLLAGNITRIPQVRSLIGTQDKP